MKTFPMSRRRFAALSSAGILLPQAAVHAASNPPLTFGNQADVYSFAGGYSRNLAPIHQGTTYVTKSGARVRSQFIQMPIYVPRRLLVQVATQFPVRVYVFKDGAQGITLNKVQQGLVPINAPGLLFSSWVSPRVTAQTSQVNRYLDFPTTGNYWLVVLDDASTSQNESSLVARPYLAPTADPQNWALVDNTDVQITAPNAKAAVAGPLTLPVVDPKKEIVVLRGAVSNSRGGQTLELLNEDAYAKHAAGKPYAPTGYVTTSLLSGQFGGVGKWYFLLNNFAAPAGTPLPDPVSMVIMVERWRRK